MAKEKQKGETIVLIQTLFNQLEDASRGKLSTNDITPDRLLWEIYNKIFSILVTCENCITFKDSLSAHLVARYTYEMLVVFVYIFLDKPKTPERMQKFLTFNQFKEEKRAWTDKTFAQMLEEIPEKDRFSLHKKHYRNLSNFAHPTLDSFLLNRRGDEYEFSMILNTVLLTFVTALEIVKICLEKDLYFSKDEKLKIDIESLHAEADRLMNNLKST